jgi:Tfp pilus assembly protein PilN
MIKRKKTSIGLDITNDYMKLVKTTRVKNDNKIEIISFKLPENIINNGVIEKSEQLAEILKKLKDKHCPNINKISLAIRGQGTLLRIISIPVKQAHKIKSVIYDRINKYINFSGVSTVIDWHKIGEKIENGEKHFEFLVAIADKKIITDYVEVMEQAGFFINAITLPTLSALRALSNSIETIFNKDNLLIVDINHDKISILALENTNIEFYHLINLNSKDLINNSDRSKNILIKNIQKSIDFLESNKNITINKILIYSDLNGALEYINNLIAENTSLPIFSADKILQEETPNLTISDISQSIIAIGAAKQTPFKINILPPEIRVFESWKKLLFNTFLVINAVMLVIIFSYISLQVKCFFINQDIHAQKALLNKPDKVALKLKTLSNQLALTTKLISGRKQLLEESQKIDLHKTFAEIANNIPDEARIIKVKIKDNANINIFGQAKTSKAVFEFIKNLKSSEHFRKVDLQIVKKEKNLDKLINFSINVERQEIK